MKNVGAILMFAWAISHAADASAATLTGVFVDPVGGEDLVVSGVGQNVIRTGVSLEQSGLATILRFDPEEGVPEVRGQTFVGGVLGFRNGTIRSDTGFSRVTLEATTESGDPDFNQVLRQSIFLLNTDNFDTNTPEQNADVLYLGNRLELGGFRVLEGETGLIEALFEFNSLDLIGFGRVLTPTTAFLTSSPFTPVDADFSVAPVPVPAALPLIVGAFGMLGIAGFRRRGQA